MPDTSEYSNSSARARPRIGVEVSKHSLIARKAFIGCNVDTTMGHYVRIDRQQVTDDVFGRIGGLLLPKPTAPAAPAAGTGREADTPPPAA